MFATAASLHATSEKGDPDETSPVRWERNDRGWMGLGSYSREKMCCFLSFASWADATIHQSFVKYRTNT